VVTVVVDPTRVTYQSATPNSGWTVKLRDMSASQVWVDFVPTSSAVATGPYRCYVRLVNGSLSTLSYPT
jgi:hypothetical protein